jgi:hypothetical protein
VPQAETVDEATRTRVHEAYGKLPLSFEENRGQVDNKVKYVSRGSGYTLFLTATEAVLTLRKADEVRQHERPSRDLLHTHSAIPNRQSAVLRMKLRGANSEPVVTGESEMGARTNYFIGNDPEKWRTEVSRYERVRYAQVYPGIDMIYYGQQRQLEYDFEVAPGVDSRQIALEFTGVKRVQVERGTGDLILKTSGGEVRQRRPVAFQEVGGERREVASRYVMQGKRKVGIEVGEYDRTQRLVIDPILGYSTYLGGSDYDSGYGIAADESGIAYVTGLTSSFDFPATEPYELDQYNAFVTKIDTNASGAASLLYSAYLGGTDYDQGNAIAVNSSGIVYVTGDTISYDFPTVNQYQKDLDGGYSDVFVTKIDTNASGAESLLYSTYLSGGMDDYGRAIAVDAAGNAYVTGYTNSNNFPRRNQFQGRRDTLYYDAFVTKINTNASGTASLLYSTYLGGSTYDEGADIAVDAAGIAYVTGSTDSFNFPKRNQYQGEQGGGDVFVTKLDTNAAGLAALLYSTYLGGTDQDMGKGITLGSSGIAYVTGLTWSSDFPTLNQYQIFQGTSDAFVTKLDTNATGLAALAYSTYLGGGAYDEGIGIAIDAAGIIYVIGDTYSDDFPTLNQYQADLDVAYNDAFVTKLDTSASGLAALVYSTYLGGSRDEYGNAIAVDSSGIAYVTGQTYSSDFPKTSQYQGEQGGSDLFVTKFVYSTPPAAISGRVTEGTANGYALSDVTITLTGEAGFTPRTVKTASDGAYSFTDVPTPGNYTLTPSKPSYIFTPKQLLLDYVTANQTDKNFVAILKFYTISGVIKYGANPLAGVKLTLASPTPAGFTARTTTTSSTGAYSFTSVPASRNYTVTPTKAGFQFNPTSKSLINLSGNQPGVNFSVKVYNVAGKITSTGTNYPISGVTVTITSPTPAGFPARSVETSSTGVYLFTALPAGRNYTIEPTKSGFTFTPTTRSITNLSSNISPGASTNFTGTQ